jgi:outer membrane receptor for ferrienterochelin and colicin
MRPKNEDDLDEVVVSKRRKSVQKSYFETQNIVTVSSDELLKAACCNLAESFETNPSIDVNFNDALTGVKQVQMMGLASPYLMISEENIPMVRGASQVYGLSFTPGTWVESMQITKGAGSVVNGFESMTGQINTELKKPLTSEKLFLNLFRSLNGRSELNLHTKTDLSPKLSTNLFVHLNQRSQKNDRNNDDFLDTPLSDQWNVLNRWQYINPQKGFVSFLNLRLMGDQKQLGAVDFDPDLHKNTTDFWGSEIVTDRLDASFKLGYVNPMIPYESIGFQLAHSRHDQDSYFGLRTYDINHQSWYGSVLFNSIIGNTKNKFKTGLNVAYDAYDEQVLTDAYSRIDRSVGGYFEYTYDSLEKLNGSLGVRYDHHNQLGGFVTPRMHLRYKFSDLTTLRFSVGSGRKTANVFSENQKLFASSRTIELPNVSDSRFGLLPERSWNYGFSIFKGFDLWQRPSSLTLDLFRTEFVNQVVVDWETPNAIRFYNLEGDSYANSLQLGFDSELASDLNLRLAYKYYDVQLDYESGRKQKPLQPEHRFFANLGYVSSKWRLDGTYQYTGAMRVPATEDHPDGQQTQPFGLINTQITYIPTPRLEWYVGAENAADYRQINPVVSANDPFGTSFDTTQVYAPVEGSMMYLGMRYNF